MLTVNCTWLRNVGKYENKWKTIQTPHPSHKFFDVIQAQPIKNNNPELLINDNEFMRTRLE